MQVSIILIIIIHYNLGRNRSPDYQKDSTYITYELTKAQKKKKTKEDPQWQLEWEAIDPGFHSICLPSAFKLLIDP